MFYKGGQIRCSISQNLTMKYLQYYITILSALAVASEAKVYERCELAKELLLVHHFNQSDLEDWVCVAEVIGDKTTSLYSIDIEGFSRHGMFQFSSDTECQLDGVGGFCNATCSSLRDDNITLAAQCALKIYQTYGFTHWEKWNYDCEDTDKKHLTCDYSN